MNWLKNLKPLFVAMVASFAALPLAAEETRPEQVLFTNVNIFDGKADKLATGMSVLVDGNLIKKIAKGAIKADGAQVIDGGGCTLMPGLINSHVHLASLSRK